MNLTHLITELGQDTGSQNQDYWVRILRKVLNELQGGADVLLNEVTLAAPTGSTLITLPWYIRNLRGVRPTYGSPSIELNTPHVGYMDGVYEQFNYAWKLIGRTPLDTSISNATRLTFRKLGTEATPVVISVSGPTSNAAQVSEDISLVDTAETTAAFKDLAGLSKADVNGVDIEVLDAAGNQLGTLPNCLTSAPRQKIRVSSYTFTDNINVLYQPYLFNVLGQEIPAGFEDAIYWKAMELHRLPAVAADNPEIYSQKAMSAFVVAKSEQLRGVKTYQNGGPEAPSYQGKI